MRSKVGYVDFSKPAFLFSAEKMNIVPGWKEGDGDTLGVMTTVPYDGILSVIMHAENAYTSVPDMCVTAFRFFVGQMYVGVADATSEVNHIEHSNTFMVPVKKGDVFCTRTYTTSDGKTFQPNGSNNYIIVYIVPTVS